MSVLFPYLNNRLAVGRGIGRSICHWGCVLAVCALGQTAQAQSADSEEPGRSPFLPQNWEQQRQAATTQTPAADAKENAYVFNGMIQIGSRTLFSVGNAETGQAMLLEIGDDSHDVQILSYDERRNVVSLSSGGGRTEDLTLRKSDGEPLAVATDGRSQRGGVPGQPPQGGRGADGQTRSAQQIAWMEARRDRMNAMIERRRAQMTGEGGSGGAVTVGSGGGSGGSDAAATAGGNSRTNGNSRASGNAVREGTQADGSQSRQGTPRSRRLRVQMNP